MAVKLKLGIIKTDYVLEINTLLNKKYKYTDLLIFYVLQRPFPLNIGFYSEICVCVCVCASACV